MGQCSCWFWNMYTMKTDDRWQMISYNVTVMNSLQWCFYSYCLRVFLGELPPPGYGICTSWWDMYIMEWLSYSCAIMNQVYWYLMAAILMLRFDDYAPLSYEICTSWVFWLWFHVMVWWWYDGDGISLWYTWYSRWIMFYWYCLKNWWTKILVKL